MQKYAEGRWTGREEEGQGGKGGGGGRPVLYLYSECTTDLGSLFTIQMPTVHL